MEHRELMLMFSDLFDELCNEVAQREGWGEETDWNEHISIDIEPLSYEKDLIDGVLFFADGTVEFHLKNEQDAYNWAQFSPKVIEEVLVRLKPKF